MRPWRDEDLLPFAALNADPRVMAFMPAVLSRAESDAFAARIRDHFARHGYGLWALEVPGRARFAGCVGLQWATFEARFTPALEVGFRLAVAHWSQGYATEAAREAVRFALEDAGQPEVVSFTARVNRRSRHVIRKVGLVRDPARDFEHPRLPQGHVLRPHVLYAIRAAGASASSGLKPRVADGR